MQSFQTKARAIDHLGRGQIADCPTAVSELWKNAYDAYARSASLEIFAGSPVIAAIFDDGHGMSESDFTNRWMIVGTESKLLSTPPTLSERNGLALRPRQGEKGIGRLSAAFLGPVTLLISKKKGADFVLGLVDWRLFENPYLTLSDVSIPVESLSNRTHLQQLISRMIQQSAENVKGGAENDPTIAAAWKKFEKLEKAANHNPTAFQVTEMLSQSNELSKRICEEVLSNWSVWKGTSKTGTALIVIDAGAELSVWVERDRDDDEYESLRKLMHATLSGFVDPYSQDDDMEFHYQVVAHLENDSRTIVASDSVFDFQQFHALEHTIVGEITENGVFQGNVKAFGVDQGNWTFSLRKSPLKQHLGPGRFKICIGTYEQALDRSTHPSTIHAQLDDAADRYAGLAIYRDGLRVMPYGRPEADFFNIEERRSKHAGREFWSYRRTFGRVALTRDENPNLRDKAGREGLIDNTARRELKALVIELLRSSARRFFNSDSEVSQELLPAVRERRRLAKEAEKRAGEKYKSDFRKIVRQLQGEVAEVAAEAIDLEARFKQIAQGGNKAQLAEFGSTLEKFRNQVISLAPPPKPKTLGRFEQEYRSFRDTYRDIMSSSDHLIEEWAEAVDSLHSDQNEILNEASVRHVTALKRLLSQSQKSIEQMWKSEAFPNIQGRITEDSQRYPVESQTIFSSVDAGSLSLQQGLKALDDLKTGLHFEFQDKYGELNRSIVRLAEGIELGAATIWGDERRAELESQIRQLTSLAQLGVTVEIVGHEFEAADKRIREQIRRLPGPCRDSPALPKLRAAIDELIGRLRFLGPLRVSGTRLKEEISGKSIREHVEAFFRDEFSARRISFECSASFDDLVVRDYTSRIVPVFLNLISNSVYWVAKSERQRKILLSAIDNVAVISDSGPGIDPDDEPSLFGLFFSRRVGGRGIGLYLCRQNLAAGGHTIQLAQQSSYKLLPGANFVISFQEKS